MLHDKCPECGAGVAFHRLDMRHLDFMPIQSLATCHKCGFNLGSSAFESSRYYNFEIANFINNLLSQLNSDLPKKQSQLDTFNVLHQLVMLLTSRYVRVRLHKFLCDQINIQEIKFLNKGSAFESRSIQERHHLTQLIGWLIINLEARLQLAWQSNAIQYNHLSKGFNDAPSWYLAIIEKFSDWRKK